MFMFGVAACFNPPEYSVIPEIEYESIKFVETPDASIADTLVLTISFKDGDGDIGLSDADLNVSDATKKVNDLVSDTKKLQDSSKEHMTLIVGGFVVLLIMVATLLVTVGGIVIDWYKIKSSNYDELKSKIIEQDNKLDVIILKTQKIK